MSKEYIILSETTIEYQVTSYSFKTAIIVRNKISLFVRIMQGVYNFNNFLKKTRAQNFCQSYLTV